VGLIVAEGTESAAAKDVELLSAMEELERAQQRVAQLRQQNREKAIAEVREKIKMYGLTSEEIGFPRMQGMQRSARSLGSERPSSPPLPSPGTAIGIEGTAVDRRSLVKPKYRSPDGQQTWSGRGKPPLWMKVFLDTGANKDDFLVDRLNDGTTQ
jgi:DNA-binding protein H-NS